MNNSLISVVIPVYNVQEYLKKCINSVCFQNYKNIEIILVNDGSTDGSAALCEELAKHDIRINVLHQENGGLSAARNTGTEAAIGKFIFYLDSDDYITSDCLEKLHNALVDNGADIAQANFYYEYPDYLLFDNTLKGKNQVFSREESMNLLLRQHIIKNFAWGKLIRSNIAKKYQFPVGKYFEDTYWKYKIINEIEKYVAVAEPMIYYLQRPASISGTFSLRNLDQLEGEALRLEFTRQHYPSIESLALQSFTQKLKQHRDNMHSLGQEDKKNYQDFIQTFESNYSISSGNTSTKIMQFIAKIKNRILNKNHFVRIEKSK